MPGTNMRSHNILIIAPLLKKINQKTEAFPSPFFFFLAAGHPLDLTPEEGMPGIFAAGPSVASLSYHTNRPKTIFSFSHSLLDTFVL